MRALDVGIDPAVGSVHDDEIECDRVAVIVKGQQHNQCSDNLRHRGARFICGSPYRTLAHELPLTEEKPKTECANCSMKCPENLRSIRRRRCGAPRVGHAANVFTPMRASSKPGMALPLPLMTSRSAHRQGVLWLRRPGRSPTPYRRNGMPRRRSSIP